METYADKNNDVLAREEYMERFVPFQLHWIEVNGVTYWADTEDERFVSDTGDDFSYLREYDGESFEKWFKDEITLDDVSYMQHAWKHKDLEAVLNDGTRPSDYVAVESLDFVYDGEM